MPIYIYLGGPTRNTNLDRGPGVQVPVGTIGSGANGYQTWTSVVVQELLLQLEVKFEASAGIPGVVVVQHRAPTGSYQEQPDSYP